MTQRWIATLCVAAAVAGCGDLASSEDDPADTTSALTALPDQAATAASCAPSPYFRTFAITTIPCDEIHRQQDCKNAAQSYCPRGVSACSAGSSACLARPGSLFPTIDQCWEYCNCSPPGIACGNGSQCCSGTCTYDRRVGHPVCD